MKILRPTDSNAIFLKLAGSLVSPFLWIKMVQVSFHSEGIQPEDQMFLVSSIKTERRCGQRLKHIIDNNKKNKYHFTSKK